MMPSLLSFAVILFTMTFSYCVWSSGTLEPCKNPPLQNLPICDPLLPLSIRANSILSNLTLSHKISLLFNTNPPKSSYPLPEYEWWSEALHGLAISPGTNFSAPPLTSATSFPQVTNLGRTFNRTLWKAIGEAISDEARGMSNAVPSRMRGLSFWAPNVNIFRDPRWGRGQETPAEDPYVVAEYAVAFLDGMQGNGKFMKTLPTCKHFAAYSLEKWPGGITRHNFDAKVSSYDLVNTYLVSFRACVERANVKQVMCSYNSVNGVPSCVNSFLIETVLRKEWGFSGHVVSDCGAIVDVFLSHKFVDSFEEATAKGLLAGCDLDCGFVYEVFAKGALERGLIDETDLDRTLGRLLENRIRLGEFDDWKDQPYRKIPPTVVNSKKHQELALDAARQSIVMLKNDDNALPLDPGAYKDTKSISVIGPNAMATNVLCGDYCGPAPFYVSVLEAIQDVTQTVSFAPGCEINSTDKSDFDEAVAFAAVSDAIVLVMGLDQTIETEGRDRVEGIGFPGVQLELIQAVAAAKQPGSSLILVLIAGGSIDLTWSKQSDAVNAIVWAGYPGQSGGQAVADVLFGKVNPAGRMAFTIYAESYAEQADFTDMSMIPHDSFPGRTYRYFTGNPVYEYGFGLSYTKFEYTWESRDPTSVLQIDLREGSTPSKFVVKVKNVGINPGDDVVLAFLEPISSERTPLLKELFGFERVHLDILQSITIDFGPMLDSYLRRSILETRSLAFVKEFRVQIAGSEPRVVQIAR